MHSLPGLRALAAALSPAGPRARLSVLIYHRVLRELDPVQPWELTAARFDAQMAALSRTFNVLPVNEAVRRLAEGALPSRAACVTFDDGYVDNLEVALPILKRHGIPATVFVATGYLDGGRMWNDTVVEAVRGCSAGVLDLQDEGLGSYPLETPDDRQRAIQQLLPKIKYLEPPRRVEVASAIGARAGCALPQNLMMSCDQVRKLKQEGVEIGAHTVNHPILTRIDLDQARREFAESRRHLEAISGAPVRILAYPNGKPGTDYAPEHVALARELGFAAAFSTAWGVATRSVDRYQLPRFTPWDPGPTAFAGRLVRNLLKTAPETV